MDQQLLRVGEAAQALNVSRWTIYRWVDEGRLKATKIGKGSLRIFRESVNTLVQDNRKDYWEPVLTRTR
ncbi:MAG: helix-turn-helix domain-containing protein [Nitrospirota bacterium]|nr:MAG: helix-turn-helix domain-containing protein [Nitrospirota bacterium]